MTYPPDRSTGLLALAVALALACGDDKASSSEGSTSEAASTATSTSGATESDGSTATSTASGTTDATTTTTDATTSDTAPDPACDLEAVSCAAAEAGGPFIDCGVVDFYSSPTEAWEAASACALAASDAEKAFKLITWVESLDSETGYAYVGFEGETYGIIRYYYDSYPPERLSSYGCGPLALKPGCTVEPGADCLLCTDTTPQSQICGDP